MEKITGMKLRAHLGHSLLLLYDKRLTKAFDLFTENEIKQHINYISYGLGRDRLKEIGVVLEDRPDGTTWTIQ